VSQDTGAVTSTGGFFVGWGPSATQAVDGLSQNFAAVLGSPTPAGAQMPSDPSKIWMYEFDGGDIKGKLALLPLGFEANQRWEFYKTAAYGGGPTFPIERTEGGNIFAIVGEDVVQGQGVNIFGINETTGMSVVVVYFFGTDYRLDDPETPEDDNIDLGMQKADTAIILVQSPTAK